MDIQEEVVRELERKGYKWQYYSEDSNFTVLSKALKPLPLPKTDAEGNTFDAFTDPEQRYRQRYADLVVNPKVKEVFVKRTKLFNAMRDFFNSS